MSVRPHIAFVCGIDDVVVDDKRYKKPDFDVWDEKLPKNDSVFPGQEKWFESVYLHGNPMTGTEYTTVAGYVISDGDEDLARALADCFGWGTRDRVFVIKPRDIPSEYVQKQYAVRDGQDLVDSANKENRWMDTYTPFYTDLYYRRAIYILHQAGWVGVTRDMLKFMIVSYWC